MTTAPESKRARLHQHSADRFKRIVQGVLAGHEINDLARENCMHVNHAYDAWRRWLTEHHPDILAATLHRARRGRIAFARGLVLDKQRRLVDIRMSRETVAEQIVVQAAAVPPIVITRPNHG